MQQTNIKGEQDKVQLVGRVIYWELYKRLKHDHTTKWYMYNPESIVENETHKLIWDFEIPTT